MSSVLSWFRGDSLRTFMRNQLLLLTGFIVAGFAYILLHIYINGLDIATRKGLTVIGSYYAQLHAKGEFDGPALKTNEFSIYVGRDNLPDWMAQRLVNLSLENYQLFKIPKNDSTKNPTFITTIPIEGKDYQLFAVYHFKRPPSSSTTKPPLIIETVLTITSGVFIILLIAIFWISRRFNRKVLRPLEGLADLANQVDETKPDITHPALEDKSEIGHVAQTLKNGVERINSYHLREKHFLQNASHELRTPITVVGSAVDIIERRLKLGKTDLNKPLQHIRQATTSMRETTEALLWLSRAEQSNSIAANESKLKDYQIDDLVNELIEQLAYLIEGRDLNIIIEITAQEIPIHDKAFLRILLSNLIRNAFEHTFEGSVRVAITPEEICVSDTGIGLSGEVDPLQRGKSNRDSFGLGLNIVGKIAELQNWQLVLSNKSEGGCVVALKW